MRGDKEEINKEYNWTDLQLTLAEHEERSPERSTSPLSWTEEP